MRTTIYTLFFGILATVATASADYNSILNCKSFTQLEELAKSKKSIEPKHLNKVKELAWKLYRQQKSTDSQLLHELESKSMTFNGKTMRYELKKVGTPGKNGYPLYIALHGGGGAPALLNDSQWQQMKRYYLHNVKSGIYVAPRGITNTWNLHFVSESYVLYDRLIENMILFNDVDPNRVYILGFSAGGDGTYQLAPRMADRWAAANMSAGHHNGVNPLNLYNVPFSLQVGEVDKMYKRHLETARFAVKLEELHKKYPQGYNYQCNIHLNKPHNFFDNHPSQKTQAVISSPRLWLEKQDRKTVKRNTAAIAWLDKFSRDPYPKKVIWDLNTAAPREGVDSANTKNFHKSTAKANRFYWLSTGSKQRSEIGADIIIAQYFKKSNLIKVDKCGNYLELLLNQKMIDLSKPLQIAIGKTRLKVAVKPNLKNVVDSIVERGDPSYIFEVVVALQKLDGKWSASCR